MTSVITLASVLGIINFIYLVIKDKTAMSDSDKKECIEVLKYVFKQSFDNRYDNEKAINYNVLISYVDVLKHLRLIRIKKKEHVISKFVVSVNDYKEGNLNDEDFIGSFTETIDMIYNLELTLLEYCKLRI